MARLVYGVLGSHTYTDRQRQTGREIDKTDRQSDRQADRIAEKNVRLFRLG